MKTEMIQSKPFSIKMSLMLLLIALLVIGCEKENHQENLQDQNSEFSSTSIKGPKGKIDICHYSLDTDTWKLINVNENAWKAHQKHGDVLLVDMDGDGFYPDNECEVGPMGDCDDNDASINPGTAEISYNGKDDDCNSKTPDDDLDGDGFLNVDDCDDTDPAINPDSDEICDNGVDDDCDGKVDTMDDNCPSCKSVCENLPDFEIINGSIDCPTDFSPNNQIGWTAIIKNVGGVGSVSSVQGWLSNDTIKDDSDVGAGGILLSAIEPCGIYARRWGAGDPSDPLIITQRYLLLEVDHRGLVEECNENNNLYVIEIPNEYPTGLCNN